MPNYVSNNLTIRAPKDTLNRIRELTNGLETEYNTVFDFNRIIPMPEELNVVSGGYDDEFVQCYIQSLPKNEAEAIIEKLKQTECFYYGDYYKKFFAHEREIDADLRKRMEEEAQKSFPFVKEKTIIGVGKQYVDNVLNYGAADWYDWCNENWGTKWNSVDARVEEWKDTIDYYFETAWSPCEPVIIALAKMFPDAKIHYSYYEPGCCFCGQMEYENGVIVYSMDGEYYEKWKDDDEDENPDDYGSGSSLSVKNEKSVENAWLYDFEYHEGFLDHAVEITGFVIDARTVKKAFMW